MPDAFTDNYAFILPEIGGSADTWGAKGNQNWAQLDSLLADKLAELDTAVEEAVAPLRGWIDDRIGEVSWCAAGTQPSNVLIPRGQTVSRTAYPKLFAKIGTTFNTGGESSSQFRLPAAQDRYIRATASGSATASGLGELLDDTFKAHDHETTVTSAGKHKHTGATEQNGQHKHTGTTDSGGRHNHDYQMARARDDSGDYENYQYFGWGNTNGQRVSGALEEAPPHTHKFTTSQQAAHAHDFTTSEQPDHTHTVTVKETGDSETRPKTIRFIPIIYCDWE